MPTVGQGTKIAEQELLEAIKILNSTYPDDPPHHGPKQAWKVGDLWKNFFFDKCTRQGIQYRLEQLVAQNRLVMMEAPHPFGQRQRMIKFYGFSDGVVIPIPDSQPQIRPKATLSSVPKLVPTTASLPTKAPAPELRKRILLCDVCGGMLEVKAHTGLQFQDCVHCQTAYVTHNSDAFRLGPAIPIKVYVLTPDLVAK